MGKCEHSDNKGDKWTVERMGPEDAWVSRGGGGNPGGEGPKGGAGSGLPTVPCTSSHIARLSKNIYNLFILIGG